MYTEWNLKLSGISVKRPHMAMGCHILLKTGLLRAYDYFILKLIVGNLPAIRLTRQPQVQPKSGTSKATRMGTRNAV